MSRTMLIAAAFLCLARPSLAQSTALTYQGELKSGGNPASGPHDVRFKLFDAASAGTQVGTTQCVDNVAVTSGRFSTTIDFGQQFASTAARYLEIEVRADSGLNCSNTTGYTTLSPRQPITSAPRAAVANTAFSLSAPDGSPASSLVVDNSGNVGIGTAAPTGRLHVNSAFVGDGVRVSGAAGADPSFQLLEGGAARAALGLAQAFGNWSLDAVPGDIVLRTNVGKLLLQSGTGVSAIAVTSTNVGIGTTTPAAKLDVRGDIKLGASGQLYAPGGEENLRIVRGNIDGNGTIINGTGFTCTRIADGAYNINFTPAFSGMPSVTVTAALNETNRFAQICFNCTNLHARAYVQISTDSGNTVNSDFSFIAIGPR